MALEIQLLIGLYFIGATFPTLLFKYRPLPRTALAQFLFGLILCLLAYLRVSLIR
jgi:hypothetical protein